MEALVHSI
jgi:hypothetical protein